MVYLCQKSLEIRAKKLKKEQEEQAEEDGTAEKGVIYDEDEDEGYDIGSEEDDEEEWDQYSDDELESDLYNTKLDAIDDILFMRDALTNLEKSNAQHYQNILGCIAPEA